MFIQPLNPNTRVQIPYTLLYRPTPGYRMKGDSCKGPTYEACHSHHVP